MRGPADALRCRGHGGCFSSRRCSEHVGRGCAAIGELGRVPGQNCGRVSLEWGLAGPRRPPPDRDQQRTSQGEPVTLEFPCTCTLEPRWAVSTNPWGVLPGTTGKWLEWLETSIPPRLHEGPISSNFSSSFVFFSGCFCLVRIQAHRAFHSTTEPGLPASPGPACRDRFEAQKGLGGRVPTIAAA